ncbi:MAG: lipoyl(octanoyl) transferase LipB [Phycisphaerales bacterium]|nr:lipoyl(octanoyl) transferase LipB [Phycisphaerales bacterium]
MTATPLEVIDLGRMAYRPAYELQVQHLNEVVAARPRDDAPAGRVLLVEHDPPVITVSRRPGARDHLLASESLLASQGIEVEETDRGGDITYHGPGQLVAYPILDLNRLGLNLHGYMRFLEDVVIGACREFGVEAHRDHCATGVWVGGGGQVACGDDPLAGGRKICAMGVRVRRWVSMHGLALNVHTNLDHFGLIVPCGLVGRPVTSLGRELGERAPGMDEVRMCLVAHLRAGVERCTRERAARRT